MLAILKSASWPLPQGGEGLAENSFTFEPGSDERPPVAWSPEQLGQPFRKARGALAKCRSGAGTVIQAQLLGVGIKAKIQTMEWGAYLKKYLDAPDMAEMSWNPSIGDPDHVTYMLLSSDRFPPAFNAGFYQNARVDELLRKGRTTVGDAERVAIYKEAQRIIADEAPWIFVDHGRQIIIHRKRVQGFKLHPNFDLVLSQVWLQ